METTSTLSQELLRAVTAEPEIAEKVQALVETMEGVIRSKQDAGEFAGLEQLAEDGRVMRFVADTLNKLPEAVTYSDKGFEAYVMLVALSREDAALRYVFRLSSWYINYGCNRELLYLCRILHIYPEREYLNGVYNRLAQYVQQMKRKRPHCTKSEELPKGTTELEIPIARVKVKVMTGEELLQAEVYLGMVKNKRLVEKVTKHYMKAKNTGHLADLCGYSLSTFRRLFCEEFRTTSPRMAERTAERQGEEPAHANRLAAAGSGRGMWVCVAIVPDGVLPDEFRGKSG
ncbi:hypothetical protein POZ12_19340 [Bacteroides uniformis]|nr:hypothetical protein [Bacteroides uniformis]MDC1865720.1 hypothetical protein [Bacteroides uniformis]MDC1869402.1 hypothetical protein [Bacteroides uniformis]